MTQRAARIDACLAAIRDTAAAADDIVRKGEKRYPVPTEFWLQVWHAMPVVMHRGRMLGRMRTLAGRSSAQRIVDEEPPRTIRNSVSEVEDKEASHVGIPKGIELFVEMAGTRLVIRRLELGCEPRCPVYVYNAGQIPGWDCTEMDASRGPENLALCGVGASLLVLEWFGKNIVQFSRKCAAAC